MTDYGKHVGNFRPDIRRCIPETSEALLKIWDMHELGTSVHSERHVRAALWFGRLPTIHDELPVIATAAKHLAPAIRPGDEWYCGVALAAEVLSDSDPLGVLFDAASTAVEDPRHAFKYLQSILPIESLTSGERIKLPLDY